MRQIHGFASSQETLTVLFRVCSATSTTSFSSIISSSFPRRSFGNNFTNKRQNKNQNHSLSLRPNLKRLTSRIVELTRRRQLRQIFEEVELAEKRYGELNTIVMNAVMEACVHCGDVDSAIRIFQQMSKSCGVDGVTYGTLLKGLGESQRIDEAFQLLESVEQAPPAESSNLMPTLICCLLNSLIEAGDLRRANGLLARYHAALRKEGPFILVYNLLMKGYVNAGFPQGALDVLDEIRHQGLKPDRRTYNTLIFACVKSGKMDAAMQFLAEMKDEAQKVDTHNLFPDAITYTTLLKGFGHATDLLSVEKIVMEMKSFHGLLIDRVAYTSMIDALLKCGSTKGALCIFGEILKKSGANPDLRPKPHLYLSMMRAFAFKGDYHMVKGLHSRMWFDTAGVISLSAQVEADELLMEAAMNDGQVEVAVDLLSRVVAKWEQIPRTIRGSMVAVRIEILSGCTPSMLSPLLLPQVSLSCPIEEIMIPFEEAKPLRAKLKVEKVVMRFFRDATVPVIDDWGSCIGLLHREDCRELNAMLSTIVRAPFPCVSTSTSIGQVINLLLEKRHKLIVVVRPSNIQTRYSSSVRAVGIFTVEQLVKYATSALDSQEPPIHRILT